MKIPSKRYREKLTIDNDKIRYKSMHINIGIQKRDELINRNVDKIVKQRQDEKTQQLMLERM